MRHILPLVLLLTACASQPPKPPTASLVGITRADQIIGRLGKPLGTVIRVQGQVRFIPEPAIAHRFKGSPELYLVVTHVDGQKLSSPVTLAIDYVEGQHLTHNEAVDSLAVEHIRTFGLPPPYRTGPEVQTNHSGYEIGFNIHLLGGTN